MIRGYACLLSLVLAACGGFAGLRPLESAPAADPDPLRPLLAWEEFPNERYAAMRGHASRVRYELRVWRAHDDTPTELVYQRGDLAEPQHRLQHALEPGTHYVWSVRAHFSLDGLARCTAWSSRDAGRQVVPGRGFHPLRIPAPRTCRCPYP